MEANPIMLVCGALLFAGTIQVAFAFRGFQSILCRLVLRIPISMAGLYLYTLAIFIQGCFDTIARSKATNLMRKRWVHGLVPKVEKAHRPKGSLESFGLLP